MVQRVLLFSDVVDSTAVVQRLGDVAASALWAEHDHRARELLSAHEGSEMERTDGFFVLFDDIAHAASFACAYQDDVRELGLAARVGLHVGSVILRHNRASDVARGAKPIEVEGLAKPLAARIMALARGGQTLLSQAAARALADSQPQGLTICRHGHYRLKGVDAPEEVFEVGRNAAAFAPPADGDKAYRVVLTDGLWTPLREVRHNLASERDEFVGRQRELREISLRFESSCRLLTLVGPGGTGKTRVARRYARTWLGEWPGGVYFCDLSESRGIDGIHFAIALALEIALGKGNATSQLGNAIAGRGRCLVILDNFEQVVAHAAATIGRWIDRALQATFLVTSRERLQLAGEAVIDIQPLSLADEAVELFAVRARAQQPDFVGDVNNRGAVARLVELLDGLPLAIELAAARIRILSPQQIVQRLQDRFNLLAGARGATARQSTLRATIDWSWELLQPWEQAALAQCSVFEGGLTLEAAEAVLDLTRWPSAPLVMDVVQSLVDKSLLRSWVPPAPLGLQTGARRFAMYFSVHDYAAERLASDGGALATQHAHGNWFARFGHEFMASPNLQGSYGRTRELSPEIDNLLAACGRAVQAGDAQIAGPAYWAAAAVLLMQGPAAAGIALGAQVMAMRDADDSTRAATFATAGRLALRAGQVHDADTWLGMAITLARKVGDETRELADMARQADLFRQQGRVDEARAQFDVALPRIRQLGDPGLLGSTLGMLGALHHEQGRLDDTKDCLREAIELCHLVGNLRGEANARGNLANLHFDQSRFDEAAQDFSRCAAMHREIGDRAGAAISLLNLGSLRERQGRYPEARQHIEEALADYRDIGARSFEGIALDTLGMICHGQRDATGARDRCLAALAIHRETGNRRYEGLDLLHLGGIEADEGHLEEARGYLELTITISAGIGDRRMTALAHRDMAKVLLASGDATAADTRLADAERELAEMGDAYELAVAWCVRGQLKTRQGDAEGARSLLAAARGTASATAANCESALGRAIAELTDALL
ncbi:MAG TPA: tetratricopeptide repeat protein [Caldimonas sp.]|jgi:predicted ATPase/class 3 adenylate cyclase